MLDFMRRPKVIFISLIIGLICIASFQAWRPYLGGEILDRVATLEDTTALLLSMTDAQKNSHFWMTLLVDYIFPFAYLFFFGGLALKFPGRLGVFLTIPAFFAFGTDIVENTVQLFALKGFDTLLVSKEFLTPTKFFFFNTAIYIAIASLVWIGSKMIYSRFKRS